MRNIWTIFRRDLANTGRSVIGLIVLVGLVIIPSLYAWFNIAGSWNPYGNTGNLKVAVANSDEGYESDLIPVNVNIGDQVVNALRANDQLDWVFVSEKDAVEGVKAGDYYAAVVIPKAFSADMMTLFSDEVHHSQIIYYENQKLNAIAPRVTDAGASTVQQQIDETFTSTIGDVGLATTSSLLDYMNSDQVTNYVTNLSDRLSSGISVLRDASANTGSYAGLMGSTTSLIRSTAGLMGDSGTTSQDAKSLMADAKKGLTGVDGALESATGAVDQAIKNSQASYDSVSASIDKAFAAGTTQANDTAKQLDAAAAKVTAQADANQRELDRLNDTSLFPPVGGTDVLAPLKSMLTTTIAKERALAQQLTEAAKQLRSGVEGANGDLASIRKVIADAKASVSAAKGDYATTLKSQANELKGTISGIVSASTGISGKLDSTVDSLAKASDSLAGNLDDVNTMLSDASTGLSTSADDLENLNDELLEALQSGDLQKIKTLIGSDPAGLAKALAAPVGIDRKPVYHIENYGSAMAPFYTAVSLWVAGIVLAAMMKVTVDERVVREVMPVRLHELYLGRWLLFAMLSLCQSTLMLAGNLLFFGIQCQDPLLFMLAGWVAGLVFNNIIYTLTVSFGDIGKALAVVLLVMQVGGSGGTFPIEMTASFFQAVYPWLPAAHVINAMHAAMAGGYGAEYWIELVKVAAYLVPSLALGLLIRRPVIRANEWIIEKLESTKLM